ncbi:DUF805 domain-containing protein [Dinoroseobacter sp. S124A]|uniref:DUF805 domain-containing protein n=1 Tax=Dinoroseobacter sp. S124A TaxID=3415128 RepID=UPI003C79F775
MGFLRAVLSAYINIVNFGGRANRAQYWCFHLYLTLLGLGLGMAGVMLATPETLAALEAKLREPAYVLGCFALFSLPSWSLLIRRLHDIDRSGFWWLIAFVPLVGAIVLFVFSLLPGSPGANRFGASPGTRRAPAPPKPSQRGPATEEDRKAEVHALYLARVKQAPS